MSCVFACVLNWSSYSSSHSRCRRFMFKNPALTLPNWGQEGSFLLHKERVLYSCVFSPDCVYMWNSDRGGGGGPQQGPSVWTWVRNTVCNGHVTVSVCLNYLAQRPDRGANQVRSSLLQRFSSLHPHILTFTHHALMLQSSCDILSVLINRNLVTKGFPHVTDVLSIMGRLRKEKTSIQLNADTEAPFAWECVRVCSFTCHKVCTRIQIYL